MEQPIEEPVDPPMASLKGNVNVPLDVYCSLIKCALHNSSLGFQSPLVHSRASACEYTIRSTIDSLLRISNGAPQVSTMNLPTTKLVDVSGDPVGVQNKVPPMAKGRLEGGIKESIDQVKTDLMNHFSLFYDLREHPIAERLEILSQKSPDGDSKGAGEAPQSTGSGWSEEAPQTIKSSVMSMVDSLRTKLEATTQKIDALESELEDQLRDPNSRVWENDVLYAKEFKPIKHDIEDYDELREHVRNLYIHLNDQVKRNQQKIDAMQKRLLTLTAHERLLQKRQANDTRVAL